MTATTGMHRFGGNRMKLERRGNRHIVLTLWPFPLVSNAVALFMIACTDSFGDEVSQVGRKVCMNGEVRTARVGELREAGICEKQGAAGGGKLQGLGKLEGRGSARSGKQQVAGNLSGREMRWVGQVREAGNCEGW